MRVGALKIVLFAALTIILGAGHGFCANLMSAAAPTANHQHYTSPDLAAHASGHPHGADESAPRGPAQHDCQHCQTAQFYNAAAKTEVTALVATPFMAIAFIAVSDWRHNHTFTNNVTLFPVHWRGPPGPTPTSRKIRLLI